DHGGDPITDPATGQATLIVDLPDAGGSFDYTAAAPPIEDYVAVSYTLDGGAAATTGTSYFFDDVTGDRTISFNYKDDKNNNGKPDDEEAGYKVNAVYLDGNGQNLTAPTNPLEFDVTSVTGFSFSYELQSVPDYVAVSYQFDGIGEPVIPAEKDAAGAYKPLTIAHGPISANRTVTVNYKDDKNNNGKPDDGDGSGTKEEFSITVIYQDKNDTAPNGAPATHIENLPDAAGSFDYTATAPPIKDYVAVSYTLDPGTPDEITDDDTSYFFDDVKIDHTIIFHYADDKNNNGKPDDEEQAGYKVTVDYLALDHGGAPDGAPATLIVDLPDAGGSFDYTADAPPIKDYVAVSYTLDGGTATPGTSYFFDDVSANRTISFNYKDDKNNNGKPDDGDGSDPAEAYTISMSYLNQDGDPIAPADTHALPEADGSFDYTATALPITDYVAVSYTVYPNTPDEITGVGASYFFDDVKANHAIIFHYEVDKNNNGVPDDGEGDYVISAVYADEAGNELLPPAQFTVTADDGYNFSHYAPAISGYLAAGFQFDGYNYVGAGTVSGTETLVQPLHVFLDSVTASLGVTVTYTKDANNNGVPDTEESYTLTVTPVDGGGNPIAGPQTVPITGANDFEVDIPAPPLSNYVPTGYQFEGENPVEGHRNGDGSYQDLRVTHGPLDADTTVIVFYAPDRNGNNTPDIEEGDYTITEAYISDTGTELASPTTAAANSANGYYYSRTVKNNIADHIAIGYQVDSQAAVIYTSGFPRDVQVELTKISSNRNVTFIYARDVDGNDIPDGLQAGEFGYTVHYYKESVEAGNLLQEITVTGVSLEDVIQLTKDQLNAAWPAYGYYMGVQQGAPVVIMSGANNIDVVYQLIKITDPRLTITHSYYRSSVNALNLEGARDMDLFTDPLGYGQQEINSLLRYSHDGRNYSPKWPVTVEMYPIVYIVEDDTQIGGSGIFENEYDVYGVADDAYAADGTYTVADDVEAHEVLIDKDKNSSRVVTLELNSGDTLNVDLGYIYQISADYTRPIVPNGGSGGGGTSGGGGGGSGGTTNVPENGVPLAVIPEEVPPLALPPEEDEDDLTNIDDEDTPLVPNPKTGGDVTSASGAASLMALLGGILMNRLRKK
ncbi:MAG: hypothetical protein LBL37_05915, partial [Gracilibacteraceae bacterium]|nr:hypothetical protein [Gracilibacteraceae bacterium]